MAAVVSTIAAEVMTTNTQADELITAVIARPTHITINVDRRTPEMQESVEGVMRHIEETVEEKLEQGKTSSGTASTVTPSGVGFDDSASNVARQRAGFAQVPQQWFCRQDDIQQIP